MASRNAGAFFIKLYINDKLSHIMPSDLCKDKIEVNVAFKIKIDPKTGSWYLKDVKMAHAEFIESE